MKHLVQVISIVEVEINETAFPADEMDGLVLSVARDGVHAPDVVRDALIRGTGTMKASVKHEFAVLVDIANCDDDVRKLVVLQ